MTTAIQFSRGRLAGGIQLHRHNGDEQSDRQGGAYGIVLAMSPGDRPAVRFWTTTTGGFGSRPVQISDPLNIVGPNLDLEPSSRECHQV
jgi:hypothetical protein